MHPELVGMNVALEVHVPDADARRVKAAAVPAQVALDFRRALRSFLAQFHQGIYAIHVIADGEDVFIETARQKIARTAQDDVHRAP